MTKEWLKQTGEWYLYHSYKNPNSIFYTAIGSLVAMFFRDGFWCVLVLWVFCALTCFSNNKALDNNPEILEEREKRMNQHIKDGDVEEYKRVLGIR